MLLLSLRDLPLFSSAVHPASLPPPPSPVDRLSRSSSSIWRWMLNSLTSNSLSRSIIWSWASRWALRHCSEASSSVFLCKEWDISIKRWNATSGIATVEPVRQVATPAGQVGLVPKLVQWPHPATHTLRPFSRPSETLVGLSDYGGSWTSSPWRRPDAEWSQNECWIISRTATALDHNDNAKTFFLMPG